MEVASRINELIAMVKQADKAILDIYNSASFTVEDKADNSPLTEADKASHSIITSTLAALFPDIPIISEEGDEAENGRILQSERFWLVDPLDGTREFVNRNDEFTICIALIENKKTVFGLISVPTKDTVYYGGKGMNAFKKVGQDEAQIIRVASEPTNIVSVSRSHLGPATQQYIHTYCPDMTVKQAGSSLKATMLAEGIVDVYPALGTSMSLWDLAASQAIVESAGGAVERPNGDTITYDAPDLKIGDFVARR